MKKPFKNKGYRKDGKDIGELLNYKDYTNCI